MVFCAPGAALATGAASAGATALGLSLDKRSVDLTKEVFLLQMRQTKRLFAAQWAEASYHHGEAIAQAAQQHAEDMALSKMQYYQAEKVNSQAMKLARDQDSRAFEMAFRTEARESLRDELANQFNRYNIVMLCDTVCLGCVYGLVVEGEPPEETSQIILNMYLFCMGGSIMLFSVSLWFCVTIVRRLHEHTASIMERKLFSDDEQLQKVWQDELESNLPTGPHVLHMVNQAYTRWLHLFISPLGDLSVNLMVVGVALMFVCAGLLTHARYILEFDAVVATSIFWATVFVATVTIIITKHKEDKRERKKEGVFDKSYLDTPATMGPMAKIKHLAEELFSKRAVRLGSEERWQQYRDRERNEDSYVADNSVLYEKAEALLKHWELRAQQRKEVLEALTAAAEEIDVIPEDVVARLNKIIHDVDEADRQTAHFVSMRNRSIEHDQMDLDIQDDDDLPTALHQEPMPDRPIDAQRTSVSLTSLRKKLGEISLTSTIRIRNCSNEALRLKSGVQLLAGQYIKDLDVTLISSRYNRNRQMVGTTAFYHLFPISEIPARTEVVIVARSTGSNWIPTSGIDGELVYVNKSDTWSFHVKFHNGTFRTRASQNAVQKQWNGAMWNPVTGGENPSAMWKISHETIDSKRNNEVLVEIDVQPPRYVESVRPGMKVLSVNDETLRAQEETTGMEAIEESPLEDNVLPALVGTDTLLMQGILFEQVVALNRRLLWQQRWCKLTRDVLTISSRADASPENIVKLTDITKIRVIPAMAAKNVFHIYSNNHKPIKLKARSAAEREKWVETVADATGQLYVADWGVIPHGDVSQVTRDGTNKTGSGSTVSSPEVPETIPESLSQGSNDKDKTTWDIDTMDV